MVNVRVRKDGGIDTGRGERKRAVVEFLLGLGALEHAAIDQNMRPFGYEGEARARYGVGGAVKTDLKGHAV